MTKNTLFVLGARDPEMVEIEKVLKAFGQQFAHASIGQNRCTPANAYMGNSVALFTLDNLPQPIILHPHSDVIFIECKIHHRKAVKRIDHHNPGDAGFDKSPAQYLEGSSLGQVLSHFGVAPTPTQMLLAAGDHCLTAAYQGHCPGIDPGELLFLRTSWQAKMSGRTLGEVIAGVLRAAEEVRRSYNPTVGASIFLDPTVVPHDLPEGAAYTGIPIIYRALNLHGILKEMIKGGSEEQILNFMCEHKSHGRRVYGNPFRGYAGAYL